MLRTSMRFVRGTVIALAICSAPFSIASAQSPSTETSIESRAADLAPGQFVWQPERAADGPVTIVVSLPMQTAYVFRAGTLIGASSVSTGLPGHDTPTGSFSILQKEKMHRSNIYDDAPMPFMQRLTWDGVALHAGHVTGEPASHGCVRLPAAFAPKLYQATSLGAQVVIADEAFASPEEALAMATTAPPAASVELASEATPPVTLASDSD